MITTPSMEVGTAGRQAFSGALIEPLEPRVLLSGDAAEIYVGGRLVADLLWQGQTVQAVQDEFLVQVNARGNIDRISAKYGFVNVEQISEGTYLFTAERGVDSVLRMARKVRGRIDFVTPNLLVQKAAVETVEPNDPRYVSGEMWHLSNDGRIIFGDAPALEGIVGADIDAPSAWSLTTGSPDVLIAVLDTGVDITHPDLAANIWTNPNEIVNGEDSDGNGFIDDINGWNTIDNNNDVSDFDSHGTHVAGTIAAVGNNGLGVTGVAWEAKIVPVKVLGPQGGSIDSIMRGIEYVNTLKRQGHNIVAMNLSLGGFIFPFPRVISAALGRAGDLEIAAVMAAGNESVNVDVFPAFPAKHSLELGNVITVAATTNADTLASFSNFGNQSVDVAAPGYNILSTVPGAAYASFSGTSMAAPVVTGIIALQAAYKPEATVAQMKQALLAGVDRLESLEQPYTLPTLVQTGGRVNAYNALRNLDAIFSGMDDQRQGNWKGAYAHTGIFMPAGQVFLPPEITVDVEGAAEEGFAVRRHNQRPAQSLFDDGRLLTRWASQDDVITINISLPEGQAHRVSFYAADTDTRRPTRSQVIEVIDTATGEVISAQAMTRFGQGQTLTWEMRGEVQVRIRGLDGGGAILNAIYIDPAPATPAAFRGASPELGGQWTHVMGARGAIIPGLLFSPPPFVEVQIDAADERVIDANSRDARALERPTGGPGIRSQFEAQQEMVLSFDFADGNPHRVTLYFVDPLRRGGSSQRVEVIDLASGEVLDVHQLENFRGGVFMTWDLSGAVQIRINNTGGAPAVLNGVFFDLPPQREGIFRGADHHTSGAWRQRHGTNIAWVLGDSTSLPQFTSITTEGANVRMVDANADARGPQRVTNPSQNVVAYGYTRTSMTVDVDLGEDVYTRRLSIYMVDYDQVRGDPRVQRVELIDPLSGEVLASHIVHDFRQGQYLSWEVRGETQIRITRLSGPDAVFSAIFID